MPHISFRSPLVTGRAAEGRPPQNVANGSNRINRWRKNFYWEEILYDWAESLGAKLGCRSGHLI
jgi:hypothetical protein